MRCDAVASNTNYIMFEKKSRQNDAQPPVLDPIRKILQYQLPLFRDMPSLVHRSSNRKALIVRCLLREALQAKSDQRLGSSERL
jgi:hypothetical protein